jgi:stage IV sporulation protein FB
MILTDSWYLLLLTVFAALAHELGHYIALRVCGGRIRAVKLGLLGASLEYDGGGMSYGAEIAAAASGPLFSLAFAAAGALAATTSGWLPALHFAGLSAILGLFNLLPAYPLDGGHAVYSACAYFLDPYKAERISFALRCAVTAAAALLGLRIVSVPPHNPTMLICAMLLLIWNPYKKA